MTAFVRCLSTLALSLTTLAAAQVADTTQSTGTTQTLVSDAVVTAAPQRDAAALRVLDQCVQSMGTPATLSDTASDGQIHYVTDPDTSVALTIKSRGEDKIRQEIARPERTYVSVMNGGDGSGDRANGKKKLPFASMAYYRPEHIPALACRLNTDNPFRSILMIGTEALKDRQVYHIKSFVKPPSDPGGINEYLSEYHVFVDTETFLVLKTQTFAYSPNAIENRSVWETYYSDYRQVNGVMMPFRLDRFSDHQKHSDVVFSNHRLDVTNTDADFVVEVTNGR